MYEFVYCFDHDCCILNLMVNRIKAAVPSAGCEMHGMENFCQTQAFDALCIHRTDVCSVFYGEHSRRVPGAVCSAGAG